jgi:hypothetical protein
MALRLTNSSERFDAVNPTLSSCRSTLKNVGQIFEIINMCLKGIRIPLQTYLAVAADRWRCLGDEALVFRVGIRATLCRRRGNDLSYKIQPPPIPIYVPKCERFSDVIFAILWPSVLTSAKILFRSSGREVRDATDLFFVRQQLKNWHKSRVLEGTSKSAI